MAPKAQTLEPKLPILKTRLRKGLDEAVGYEFGGGGIIRVSGTTRPSLNYRELTKP